MSLPTGTRLGSFEIVGSLGAGGMGEVYRARDTKLKREVALKVLPHALADDPERMARLQREAELLASLNHSNIAAIYGLEDRALVMELVEGRTLAESIPASGLPIDEALRIASQIADGLQYAHERGIVHRDLKPANIKLTPQGIAKLLDFGLAKAAQDPIPSTHLTQSPTMAAGMTQAGVILGTAAYMSPEQARGKDVDRRADIWAFGVVLYELLTGKPTFSGDTTTDILASVVKDEPNWTQLPSRARRLLRACLQRDPTQRLQSIGDWRLLLDDDVAVAPALDRRPVTIALAALAAVSVVIASWGWLRPQPTQPRQVMRFSVSIPEVSVAAAPAAITLDGSRLAMATGPGRPIYLRALEEPDAVPIRGSEGGGGPSFSPDGQSIAFFVQSTGTRQLKKLSLSGGGAVTLADKVAPGAVYTSWEVDNTILYTTNSGLFRISAEGGPLQHVASNDREGQRLAAPQLLPGGRGILVTIVEPDAVTRADANTRIAVVDVPSGKWTVLLDRAGHARYVPSRQDQLSGHIVYGREGSLIAVPFDVSSFRLGSRMSVLDGVMGVGGFHLFTISASGTLVYSDLGSAAGPPTSALIWKDRQGKQYAIPGPPRAFMNIRLSHNGTTAAVAIQRPPMRLPPLLSLGVLDLVRGTFSPLTTEGTASLPLWSHDDRRLWFTYVAADPRRPELHVVAADGSGSPSAVSGVQPFGERTSLAVPLLGPDGPMAIVAREEGAGNEIFSIPLEQDSQGGKPRPLFAMRFRPNGLEMSPDGQLLAYQSNETGRNEVWVTPFPGPGPRVLVSTDGGEVPRWNPKGRELFYRNSSRFMAVEIQAVPTLRAGSPKVLFDSPDTIPTAGAQRVVSYDVSPDGQRFLLIKPETTTAQSTDVHVIVNWADELARKAPFLK